MATIFRGPLYAKHHRRPDRASDTSRGTPKTLYADANKPAFDPPPFVVFHPRRRGWLNPDTSRGVPKTLYADANAAFQNPSLLAAQRKWFIPADGSQETPNTLRGMRAFVNMPTGAVQMREAIGDCFVGPNLVLTRSSSSYVFNPLSGRGGAAAQPVI